MGKLKFRTVEPEVEARARIEDGARLVEALLGGPQEEALEPHVAVAHGPPVHLEDVAEAEDAGLAGQGHEHELGYEPPRLDPRPAAHRLLVGLLEHDPGRLLLEGQDVLARPAA